METTTGSLLRRLRQSAEPAAWERLVRLYTPMMFSWGRRLGLGEADAADLVQDVLATLVKKLPDFQYDSARRFRGWLRTVFLNRWRDLGRQRANDPTLARDSWLVGFPDRGDPDEAWEAEYHQHLVGRALELMRAEFAPKTWKACWEHVVVGRSAAEVAAELGISVGSVYVAKSRVLCMLRRELEGLWE